MNNKTENLKDTLISLAEGYYEFSQKSRSIKKLWYWEYYQSIERDIKDAKLRRKIYQQIYHLERFGYFNEKGFTAKALDKLKKWHKKDDSDKALPKWDKKWRIVIFDIPEIRKTAREYLRFFLKEAGFKMLQNSNWICPYGDFDEIQNFIKEQNIEKYVILIVSDKISNELLYKKKFDLL